MNKRSIHTNNAPEDRGAGIGECPAKRTSSEFNSTLNNFRFASIHRARPAQVCLVVWQMVKKARMEFPVKMPPYRALWTGLFGTVVDRGPEYSWVTIEERAVAFTLKKRGCYESGTI